MTAGAPGSADLPAVFAALAAGIEAVREVERLAPAAAAGRVLARALVAARDLPGTDVAAMDGYALRALDAGAAGAELCVAGRVLAGEIWSGVLPAGHCLRIMTGAAVPPACDAVVMLEDIGARGVGAVWVPGPVAAGLNVRPRGEHVRAGATVLRAGRRLRAADVGLASSLGATHLDVFRRLVVGVASTGDELRDPPAALPPGCAFDANRPMLIAALERAGVEVHDLGICPDDARALERVREAALERGLDALLLTGGAAQGDADIVRALAGARFVALAVRPGRGIVVARAERAGGALLILGLPGNAVAAYVLLHLLALPLLLRCAGADQGVPEPVLLPLARDAHARSGHCDMRRARLVRDAQGRLAVELLAEQGAAMLRTVSDAHALVAVGPEPLARAGDLLPVYVFRGLES